MYLFLKKTLSLRLGKYNRDFHERGTGYFYSSKIWLNAQKYLFLQEIIDSKTNNMKTNFVKSRWLFTMLLFVTTMIMPTMMLAEESITPKRPEGEGTAEKPFKISNREELYWFAGLVNGTLPGEKKNVSANAILMNDITVNEGVLDEHKNLVSGKEFIPWTPIGTSYSDDKAYSGTFEGNKHTISGLYFDKTRSYQVGLFGHIGAKGKLFNVGVLDSYFQFNAEGGGVCGVNYGVLQNCSNSSTVIGTDNGAIIGGVCGTNDGTVRDCKNTGSVRGHEKIGGVCGRNEFNGIIENCFNEGTFSETVESVGGVCGYNSGGTIKSCHNTASVSGTGNKLGGVCSENLDGGTITNCFNEGTVSGQYSVGGVCGINSKGVITNCFNKGTVSGADFSVGGVCGNNQLHCTIKSCYNTGSVHGIGDSAVGGVCGYGYGGTTNCYYLSGTATGGIKGKDVSGSAEKKSIEQFKSGEVTYLLAEGKVFDEQAWGQQLGTDQYPVLGSDYKVIKAAQGDKDANGNDTYWATFSNLTNDATLSVQSGRTLNVYNATVRGGKLTLTQRSGNQVAKEEGVLLKTDGEYVNAKANETNELTAASSEENHLVATPAEAQTVTAETGYILYRLTYKNATTKEGLGFYLSVDKDNNSYNGTRLKATPGKAYLKVSENEAKDPSSAALARSFVFGGGNETTGIEGITIMGTDVQRHGTIEGIFDLQGRKIVNPTKGIYIKNNKKVVIK